MLTLREALTVNGVRARLRKALRTGDVYAVRREVVEVLAELGSVAGMQQEYVDQNADTIRCPAGPDFEPDSAPPIPITRPSGGP